MTWRFCEHLIRGLALACIVGVSAIAAPVHEPRCRGNSALIGQCYWIRGVYALSADAAMIIERDDNGRWVIIRGAHHRRSAEPGNLIRFATKMVRDTGYMSLVNVHGVYEVCPVPQDGAIEGAYACIQSATRLRRVSPDWVSPARKRLHDRDAAAKERDEARAVSAQKEAGALAGTSLPSSVAARRQRLPSRARGAIIGHDRS